MANTAQLRALIADPSHGDMFPRALNPDELPDVAPEHHPTPWTCRDAGNGHRRIVDANGRIVAPVFVWDDADQCCLTDKLARINVDTSNESLLRCREPGWVEIGKADPSGRRSLWVRFGDGVIELCAGREGDDAYARILDSSPDYEALRAVLHRAEMAATNTF